MGFQGNTRKGGRDTRNTPPSVVERCRGEKSELWGSPSTIERRRLGIIRRRPRRQTLLEQFEYVSRESRNRERGRGWSGQMWQFWGKFQQNCLKMYGIKEISFHKGWLKPGTIHDPKLILVDSRPLQNKISVICRSMWQKDLTRKIAQECPISCTRNL